MSNFKLIINFKTYEESFGENALKICNIIREVNDISNNLNVEIIVVPQLVDLREVVKTGVKVYSQHIDDVEFGAHTGHIVPEELIRIGVKGSLVSHSEDADHFSKIEKKVQILKNLNLESCVCARDNDAVKRIRKFSPNFIAVEPPELIGGDISVSKAKPELISSSVKIAEEIPLLVGAGIKCAEDIRIAVQLGAKGILIASGLVKAKNFKEKLLELLSGFSN